MKKNRALNITPTRAFQIKTDLLDAVLEIAKDAKNTADFPVQRAKIISVLLSAGAMAAETREVLEAEAARWKRREEDFSEVLKCFQEATAEK